jgi:hypothetical protein
LYQALLANQLALGAGWRMAVVAALLLGYALWTGVLNSVLAKPPDLYTPFEFIRESLN